MPVISGPANVPRLSPSAPAVFALTRSSGRTATDGRSASVVGRTSAPGRRRDRDGQVHDDGWSTTIAAATTAAPAARSRLTATSTRSGRGARVASTRMLTTIAGSIRNSDTRPTATAPPAS